MPRRRPWNSDQPPRIASGLDAIREWSRWPFLRLGVRAYLRSTYDRTGHNNTADASHYLYQEHEGFNVTLDVEGSGVLCFTRANRWHGSPWHYEVDGQDHLVEESSTADPLAPLAGSVFRPEAAFPAHLTYTWSTTHGADLCWVPMPFAQRLRIAHTRTYYGTGYYIYHLYAEPHGLPAWSPDQHPGPEPGERLARTGERALASFAVREGTVTVPAAGSVTVVDLDDGPAMVRELELSVPAHAARDFGAVRLVATWDERAAPSIDAPVALMFGAGRLIQPAEGEWLVKALPVSVRFAGGRAHLACRLPMPYFRGARIALAHTGSAAIDDVRFRVATEPYGGPWNHVGYLHATFVDHGEPVAGRDLVFLDTRNAEGEPHWCGSLVGTAFVFTHRNVLTTLEGDPRFFFDDAQTPQAQGTGTEEWGGGGDYWGGQSMTLPLVGHPTGSTGPVTDGHGDGGVHSAYRFLLSDLMPFGRRARVCFEHGGENESLERYESVTFWYGLPGVTLELTDTLDVGDPESEAAHGWRSPDASPPYRLSSRYEWGPDHLPLPIARPLAEPPARVEWTFDISAGAYDVWVEARVGERLFDAALWLQFDGEIGTRAFDVRCTGSMGIPNAGRPAGAWRFVAGSVPTGRIDLREGPHGLRLQPRHGRMRLARIVLAPAGSPRPRPEEAPGAGCIVLLPEACAERQGYALIDDRGAARGRALEPHGAPAMFEVFPEQQLTGRRTQTWTEFELALVPDNHGVLLRRTLDYGFANQRAQVLVEENGAWQPAGVWYLAGSNTVYHSFPWQEGELAPVRPEVVTSNRRLRDDEFQLPARLTRGRTRIRLRLEFAPRNPPLLQGRAPEPTAWTEFAYAAYCWVMPRIDP